MQGGEAHRWAKAGVCGGGVQAGPHPPPIPPRAQALLFLAGLAHRPTKTQSKTQHHNKHQNH